MTIGAKWNLRELLGSQLSKDLLYTFSAQMFVMLSVFVVNKLVSMGQSVEGFADYSIIRKSATLCSSLFALGITEALTHYYAYQKGRRSVSEVLGTLYKEAVRVLLYSAMFFLIIFVFLRRQLSEVLFDSEGAWRQLGLVYVFAVGICFYQFVCSYYLGRGDFKRASLVQVGVNSIYLIVAVLFSQNAQLLFVLWSGLTLAPLIVIIVLRFRFYPKYATGVERRVEGIMRRRLLYYGITRMGSGLVLYGMDVLPLVIVLHQFGQRYVSFFSASITVLLTIIPLFAFTTNLFLQRVSLMRATGNFRAIARIVRMAAIPFAAIALFGWGVLYFFSDEAIRLLYTKEFLEAKSLISITSLALIPKAFFFLLKSPVDALSDKPYVFLVMLVSCLMYAVMLWQTASIEGCAWAYVWTNVIMMVLLVAVWRVLLLRRFVKRRQSCI